MDQQAIVYIIDPDDNDRNIVRETATALQAASRSAAPRNSSKTTRRTSRAAW